MKSKSINLILIGVGPHAKRVYLPALVNKQMTQAVNLVAVVELTSETTATIEELNLHGFNKTKTIFTDKFKPNKGLPKALEKNLNNIIKTSKVHGVIIATEPLVHMDYAKWAIKNKLHILIDKPLSTYENIVNKKNNKMLDDLNELIASRSKNRALIINTQRRYHPGMQTIKDYVAEVAKKYRAPITSISASHYDGQWRLPSEIVSQDYHPYNTGYGKLSHSGYHSIDNLVSTLVMSYKKASKSYDNVRVFTKHTKPTSLIHHQSREDLVAVFGKKYLKSVQFEDKEFIERFSSYGEVDIAGTISLYNNNQPVSLGILNIGHNGVSGRNWLKPGSDLYKGNGRIKHESLSIVQGPYQTIHLLSYQSKDNHAKNNSNDLSLGGNNHFDIHIFRNHRVMGGEAVITLNADKILKDNSYSSKALISEQVKFGVVDEFVDIIAGKKQPHESLSGIESHYNSVLVFSMLYKSGASGKEVRAKMR